MLDQDAVHYVPAASPATDEREELALPSSNGDDDSNGAGHPRAACECLISNGCLDGAYIR